MFSTMMDRPLTVQSLFERGEQLFGTKEVVSFDGTATTRVSFAQLARRVRQLAAALLRLGVRPGDRVGSFCWNCQEHLEAYFAVPCIGAVLHTLNLRLFPEQIAYAIDHAEDRVIIVEQSLLPILLPLVPLLPTLRCLIVADRRMDIPAACGSPIAVYDYEAAVAAESADLAFPEVDERSAAAMCHTSGTTGNPKGVVYSHRSISIHSMVALSPAAYGLSALDRVLVIPSMFHANAWGIPHAAWWTGADLILPGRHVQAEPLARLVTQERPTFAGAVPAIWNDFVRFLESGKGTADLSSLRLCIGAGSAVPRSLIERMQRLGVRLVQLWGMTETGPLAALSHPPVPCVPGSEEDIAWRSKTGRILHGIDLRIVDGERVLPWDGKSIGEIEVRGPWVAGSYYKNEAPERFRMGWLRTGDVGTVDPLGYIVITDRAKDVIKSGGEWVSSVELENHLMHHPDVVEAAVIAVPDERWDERPLACVVVKPGSATTLTDLREFLSHRVARWWLPERWSFIEEVPKTSVGKFNKKALRQAYAEGKLPFSVAPR